MSKLLSLIVSMKPYHALPIISVYAKQTLWDLENHSQPVARISGPMDFFNANFELVFSNFCLAVGITEMLYLKLGHAV